MIQLKNTDDINHIREAGNILFEALAAIKKIFRAGITTLEIDGIARREIERYGGTPAFLGYHGFPASVCISINEQVIHGIPGKRKLQEGDLVGLDIGVVLKGYVADAAVTLPVGKVTPEDELLLKVSRECLALGIGKAVAGNRVRDISEAIYTHALAHDFDVVREYCGHGVGFACMKSLRYSIIRPPAPIKS